MGDRRSRPLCGGVLRPGHQPQLRQQAVRRSSRQVKEETPLASGLCSQRESLIWPSDYRQVSAVRPVGEICRAVPGRRSGLQGRRQRLHQGLVLRARHTVRLAHLHLLPRPTSQASKSEQRCTHCYCLRLIEPGKPATDTSQQPGRSSLRWTVEPPSSAGEGLTSSGLLSRRPRARNYR